MRDTFKEALLKLNIDFEEELKKTPPFIFEDLPSGIKALNIGKRRYGGCMENEDLFAWYLIDKHFGFSFDKRSAFEEEQGLLK